MTTALINITNDILRVSYVNKDIYLDYRKAFDTINHTTLITKLKYFSIGAVE